MKRILLIIFMISLGCNKNGKNEYEIKKVSVAGETRDIKIPKGEKFKDGVYDELQAARIINLNLPDSLKEKITLRQVESLISYQGEFIIDNQNANVEYELLSEKNINFLKKRSDSNNMNLTKQDLINIFEIDDYYAKLINIID